MARLGAQVSNAVLGITGGGTGQVTAQAAIDALLPTQSGNSGYFLATNGSAAYWADGTGIYGANGSNTQVQYSNAGVLAGSAGFTYDKTNDILTLPNLTAATELELSGCNVTYVPITGDLSTYISNATAGDVLILASGTYTVPSGAYTVVNKAITLKGQGQDRTKIYSNDATSNIVLNITASNVYISDLTVEISVATSTTLVGIRFSGNLTGNYVENVNIVSTLGTGSVFALEAIDSDVTARNVNVNVVQSAGVNYCLGFYFHDTASNSASRTITLINCNVSATGNSSSNAVGVATVANGSAYNYITYLYHVISNTGNSGSGGGIGIDTENSRATGYYFHCMASGKTYDFYNASAAVTTWECYCWGTLNGTITASGTTYTKSLVTGNQVSGAGNIVFGTSTGTKIGTSALQKIGFFGATPVVQSTGWAGTNYSSTKTYDATNTTLNAVANTVCTLVEQLKTYGLLGA